jgi:uncharacterized NAD-dependent epimerase/dehydratase family protein
MQMKALVYCENEFGKIDGKVANGLVRCSENYEIVGIIDSSKKGLDAGEYLDGEKTGIPIFNNLNDAVDNLNYIPEYFIYGIAPLALFLDIEQRNIIFAAMKKGMNIVNGLPEFLTDDKEFIQKSLDYSVKIFDVRKPPKRQDQHIFSGRNFAVKTPTVVVFGTDCATGKRTTALKLVAALRKHGLKTAFITTGQTGILQGSQYGIAVDVLTSGFATGEIENAIVEAVETEHPDIIIVEGQGALSHPAFTSSSAIIRGAKPNAIIVQHPPKRVNHCDYPDIPMPTVESEIELIEMFSKTKVIAITLNHEDMTDAEINETITVYEETYKLPTTDVLKHGCDKLVNKLLETFPELSDRKGYLYDNSQARDRPCENCA